MNVLLVIFYICSMLFIKQTVNEVKTSNYQTRAIAYCREEKKWWKRYVIAAIIAIVAIIIWEKYIVTFALLVLHLFAVYILYRMIKNAAANVDGKNSRFGVTLYVAGKLLGVATVVAWLATLIC